MAVAAEIRELHLTEAKRIRELLSVGLSHRQVGRIVYGDLDISDDAKRLRVGERIRLLSDSSGDLAEGTTEPDSARHDVSSYDRTSRTEEDFPPPAVIMERPPSPMMPRPDIPNGDDFLKLEGDFLALSDTHLPYHDPDFIDRAIDIARDEDIDQFLLIGDLNDGNQWSKRGLQKGYQRDWWGDVLIVEQFLNYLLYRFRRGVVLNGNHDDYFLKHLKGHVKDESAASMLFNRLYATRDRITYSAYEQAEVISGGVKIRCTHGANYSAVNPLGVTQRLAAKWECSVITAHQHAAVSGRSWSGKHQCVALGGCYDPRKLHYLHQSPRTNPHTTRSFAIIKHGIIRHYIEGEH